MDAGAAPSFKHRRTHTSCCSKEINQRVNPPPNNLSLAATEDVPHSPFGINHYFFQKNIPA
jgi:hypothetical protein